MAFAPPVKSLVKGPPNTLAPAGGFGLTLNEKGKVPAEALVEAWHEIAVGSNPGFQNSWVNFDTVRVARYYKDALGIVHLGGLIKNGTIGATAFTLPEGYRPSYADSSNRISFAVESNGAYGQLRIGGDGVVIPQVGSNVSFFLDGVTYQAV